MTLTTPSPISQAAGEPVTALIEILAEIKEHGFSWDDRYDAIIEKAATSTAPTTGSASLRSDEWADSLSPQWKSVVAASASPAASVLSEDAILAIAIDHGLGTAVVESIAKDLLAASTGGEKS